MNSYDAVEQIIAALDETRFSFAGGYPSDWKIEDGKVFIATIGGSDWNEPTLIIQTVDEFIQENHESLDDDC